jgi:hypothetical protein
VKLNGYVNCTPEFHDLPLITDAASTLLVGIFGDSGRHARTTVGVSSLPADVAGEIELIARLKVVNSLLGTFVDWYETTLIKTPGKAPGNGQRLPDIPFASIVNQIELPDWGGSGTGSSWNRWWSPAPRTQIERSEHAGDAATVYSAHSGPYRGQRPLKVQRETSKKLAELIRGLSRKQLTRKPAPGKWSISEILAHLADTEIVVAWRLRHILGNNGAPIQAYDQNVWAETFDYAHRDAKESLEFFQVLRTRNLAMLKALPKEFWENYGMHQERVLRENLADTAILAGLAF